MYKSPIDGFPYQEKNPMRDFPDPQLTRQETFGGALYYLRTLRAGLNLTEMSDLMRVRKQTLSSWEKNEADPYGASLRKAARGYRLAGVEISAEDLIRLKQWYDRALEKPLWLDTLERALESRPAMTKGTWVRAWV